MDFAVPQSIVSPVFRFGHKMLSELVCDISSLTPLAWVSSASDGFCTNVPGVCSCGMVVRGMAFCHGPLSARMLGVKHSSNNVRVHLQQ